MSCSIKRMVNFGSVASRRIWPKTRSRSPDPIPAVGSSNSSRRVEAASARPGEGPPPRIRQQLAGEQIDERRLSRAVGADDCGDTSLGNREIHARDCGELGKGLTQTLHLEQCAHLSFRVRLSNAPTRPPRKPSTMTSSTSPKTSNQYSVTQTISSLRPR